MQLPRITTWGIVGLSFLGLAFGFGVKAYTDWHISDLPLSPNQYKQPTATPGALGHGLLFTATTTGSLNHVTFKYCRESDTEASIFLVARLGIYTSPSNILWIATSSPKAVIDFPAIDYHTSMAHTVADCNALLPGKTFTFPTLPVINNGFDYVVDLRFEHNLTVGGRGYMIGLATAHSNYKWLEGNILQTTMRPSFSLGYDVTYTDPDAEVIDIEPDPNPVEVWGEEFNIDTKICYIGYDCFWWFQYGMEYDNGIAYLINENDPHNRSEAIATSSLAIRPVRSEAFDVPSPAVPGTYFYCIFLEKASSTTAELTCGHQINWYTDHDTTASSSVKAIFMDLVDTLTNVFPVSIAKQIFFYFLALSDATTTPAVMYLQDIMPDAGDAILGSTNPPLLSYQLLKENLPIWDDYILRFMNYCVYLVGFFICLFLVFPRLRSIDLGGHQKVAGTPGSEKNIPVVNLRSRPADSMTIDLRKTRY